MNDQPERIIEFKRLRCPKCGGTDLHTYKTKSSKEHDEVTRYTRCRDEKCKWQFVVLVD